MPSFARPATLRELAALVGGEIVGNSELMIAGIASLEKAGPGDLSFLAALGHTREFLATGASAVLVGRGRSGSAEAAVTVVLVDDSHAAVQRVLEEFFPEPDVKWGVSPGIVVGASVRWAGRIAVGTGSSIADGTRLGSGCVLGRNVVVGKDVEIGDSCRLDDGVVLGDGVRLGDRVSVFSGARVGTPGFGFVTSGKGSKRMPHPGGCIVGDDVEIGANTTIDGGTIEATVIGDRTKIDNLVQIAHNVQIGTDCILAAQAGLAGSTVLEDGVMIAGQAGLAGHLRIGAGARIAAQSGVIGDVPPGATVSGYPARNHRDVLRQVAALSRITAILDELEALIPDDGS